MSVKSKHSSKKDKSGKKEKKKKMGDSEEDIESSDEELDLTKECHPIGYYINNRAEMINQMFSVIKGNKLKAMLPPILKETDLEQLKLQCLDQLLGMSEKRIKCILEGETLDTSSESEVLESDYDSDEKNGTSSSSDRSDDSQGSSTNNLNSKQKKRKGDLVNDAKAGKVAKVDDDAPPEQGKTLLEILELEMRARAIRALLKQSGIEKGSDQISDEKKTEETNKNGLQDVSEEVVDLTGGEDEEFPVCVKKENTEESDIDKKVSTFEEKIKKSKSEKLSSVQEDEKSKKLQAELELRNKLFKKKIYRTRQQRLGSEEEEDKNVDKNETQSDMSKISDFNSSNVVIKQEPVEVNEIVIEDPEEGEIETSEDEEPVIIKQEIPDEPPEVEDSESKMDENSERVTAVDENFVSNISAENKEEDNTPINENVMAEMDKPEEPVCEDKVQENTEEAPLSETQETEVAESENNLEEEASWRDRWLKKDGVQKLVKSSKIYAKVKKRIAQKSQRAKEEVPNPYEANSDSNSNSKLEVVEGSIEEYERLTGKQSKENDFTENGNSQQSVASENDVNINDGSEVLPKES